MTKAELIKRIVKLEDENRELILKNEELKKQIPCGQTLEFYKKSANELNKENDLLLVIKKQAEFIMRKIS